MINRERFYIIERAFEPLSLAVFPQDRTTLPPAPFGEVRISLVKVHRNTIKNPGGYYIYLGLEDGDYEVQIDADYYVAKNFTVAVPDPAPSMDDELNFVDLGDAVLAEVTLIPDASYPFPSGATLLRGEVLESDGSPAPQAKVTVLDDLGTPSALPAAFHTNAKGQFVLFCNKLTKDLIKEINGKPYEGSRNLRLRAEHPVSGVTVEGVRVMVDFKTVYITLTF